MTRVQRWETTADTVFFFFSLSTTHNFQICLLLILISHLPTLICVPLHECLPVFAFSLFRRLGSYTEVGKHSLILLPMAVVLLLIELVTG